MVSKISLGVVALILVHIFSYEGFLRPAFGCNRTAGCAMDNFQENYDMMHSGKMSDAMRAGQANIDAFRRFREAEQAWVAGGNATKRKK